MPKIGDEEFAYTPEGIEAAKAKAEETGLQVSNAMDRSQSYQMGGLVQEYKEGGIIKKTIQKHKAKKAEKKREKARKESVKKNKIIGVVEPKKKGLKPAVVPSNPPLFKGDTVKEKILNTSILYKKGKKEGEKVGKKAGVGSTPKKVYKKEEGK